jgi:hypothetical protein
MAKLNQKLFGNRNIGSTSTTADDKIGGEGIASVTLYTLGSYPTQPTVTFPAPTLPTGVTATGTVTSEVLGATIAGGAAGSGGYTAGNILTVTDSTGTATFTVATVSAGGVATVTPLDRGTFTGALTTLARTTTVAVGAGTTTGTGCTLTLIYRAKAVVITEQGSGYTSAPAGNTLTFTQSVTATSTALTTDSGAPGSSTNQENSIYTYAKTTSGGTSKLADIIKQRSTKRFKVKTADGTAICTLKGSAVSAVGEMTIIAQDSTGGTYYVTKIGARRCTITQGNGTAFATDSSVPWTFASPAPSGYVTFDNA